jgi:hypothetical protein
MFDHPVHADTVIASSVWALDVQRYVNMDWMDLDSTKLNMDLELDWITVEWTVIGLLHFGPGR